MATVGQLSDQLLSSLSQEQILKKRRNRDEIRSLYTSYRRIRFCVSQKDARLMPDFEQAYLSLITASRGCTSVQRIVSELIPQYASFCPTALEAATQVSINMYTWSLNTIMKGEDIDGAAYQTAKACISGLVEICSAASQQKPTSSVISGICSSVFQTVLNFFVSTFENKDIYTVGYSQIEKLLEPMESCSDINQEMVDDDETPLLRLFKFRVLCLFRVFMCHPKNIVDACFEVLVSKTDESLSKGVEYFLRQLTSQFNSNEAPHTVEKISDRITEHAESAQTDSKGSDLKELVPGDSKDTGEHILSKNSFIEMGLHNEPSLRFWMLSSYKKLLVSFKPDDLSVISYFLEKIFGSLSDALKEITYLEINNKPLENVDTAKTKDCKKLILKKPLLCSNFSDPSVPSNTLHNAYQSPSRQSFYSQKNWYCDGDPSSMDVFSASNQLWVSSLGYNASESSVRAQFEAFGELILYIYLSAKGFVLVEYKSIFDAVRARSYMQGSSIWGGRLCVKFLDSGVGSKGTVKTIAVGNSCHVYVGKVMTQRENDEILHVLKMAGIRKPLTYNPTNENALLLEFSSAEEATNAMTHIRQFRSNAARSHHVYYSSGVEFTPWNPYSSSFAYKQHESGGHELASPRLQVMDVRPSNFGDYGRSMLHDQSYAGHMSAQYEPRKAVHSMYYNPWDTFSPSAKMTHTDNHMYTPRPAVPFLPSSITPVSQLSVNPPPPPPYGAPHSPPPPPSSPPPELSSERQWEGTLSKSKVRFCRVYATRQDLPASKYSNAVSEPSDWPPSLDVTKRTDIGHVKTTFANTRPHRREVCRLVPCTPSDDKGLQDFIAYLKQRECAGVIKIPSGRLLWARLLFIVPPSSETCSLLGLSPHLSDCLLAVVLPKDSNNE